MYMDHIAEAEPTDERCDALERLLTGEDLRARDAEQLFARLVAGGLQDVEIAGLLTALRVKGETAEELVGAARALRAADADFPRPDYLFADSCGTGGDGSGTINVSTAAALTAAACGLPVAKHGNRSISSRCGSADVLEQLGAKLDIPPKQARLALDEAGFCFLFAPNYHPGLRHAGPARRALKVRTIMNLLGPCLNPAEPPVQLLGVAEPKLLRPVAETLAALGVRNALVIHGAGLDEIALHGRTEAVRLEAGRFEALSFGPEDAGLTPEPLTALHGGGPEENAERLKALLMGRGGSAEAKAVAINAGALLMTAGLATGLREGTQIAAEAIASGAAYRPLAAFIKVTRG